MYLCVYIYIFIHFLSFIFGILSENHVSSIILILKIDLIFYFFILFFYKIELLILFSFGFSIIR